MLPLFLFCDFLSVLTFLNVSAAAAHQQRAAEIYLIHDILQTHAGDHSKQERRDSGVGGGGQRGNMWYPVSDSCSDLCYLRGCGPSSDCSRSQQRVKNTCFKSRGIIRLRCSLMHRNWKHVELLSSVSSGAASPRPGCDDGCSNVG